MYTGFVKKSNVLCGGLHNIRYSLIFLLNLLLFHSFSFVKGNELETKDSIVQKQETVKVFVVKGTKTNFLSKATISTEIKTSTKETFSQKKSSKKKKKPKQELRKLDKIIDQHLVDEEYKKPKNNCCFEKGNTSDVKKHKDKNLNVLPNSSDHHLTITPSFFLGFRETQKQIRQLKANNYQSIIINQIIVVNYFSRPPPNLYSNPKSPSNFKSI